MQNFKICLAVALMLAVTFVQAQDEEVSEFKPKGGDHNLELRLAPLSGTPISIPGIRYRNFQDSKSAFRLNVFLGYDRNSTITQEEDGDRDLEELRDINSNFDLTIRPGYEIHFGGTDRLSPYFGGELDLGFGRSREVNERQDGDGDVLQATTRNGYFRIGLNAVAGFDYYIAKNLYLGTELGYGFGFNLPSATRIEDDDSDIDDVETSTGNTRTFNLAPTVVGQIRIGYIF